MLRSLFLYIRQKPKGVRNQIALAISSVFTGVVAIVWFMGQVGGSTTPASETMVGVSEVEYEAPFSSLINQFKDQFASVRSAFDPANTVTEEVPPSVPVTETATSMTLSAETIASSSVNLREASLANDDSVIAIIATSSASTTPMTQDLTPTTTPTVIPGAQAIQIATSSSRGTTTPPL